MEPIGGLELSPADPGIAVWVKSSPNREQDEAVSHLFRSTADGQIVQLTRGKEGCTDPRFSPDGQRLAFLSARPFPQPKTGAESAGKPKAQIWILNGGDPYPITDFSRKVLSFAWRDAKRLVFTAQEPAAQRGRELEEKKDKARVVEDEANEPPVRLFEVELSSGKVTRLTTNPDRISTMVVSPDGQERQDARCPVGRIAAGSLERAVVQYLGEVS